MDLEDALANDSSVEVGEFATVEVESDDGQIKASGNTYCGFVQRDNLSVENLEDVVHVTRAAAAEAKVSVPQTGWIYMGRGRWEGDCDKSVRVQERKKYTNGRWAESFVRQYFRNPLVLQPDSVYQDHRDALLYAYVFMLNHPSDEVRHTNKKHIAMQRNLKEITGIGDGVSEKMILEKNVNSYEDALDSLSLVQKRFRNDARQELEERISNGERLLDRGVYMDEYKDRIVAERV